MTKYNMSVLHFDSFDHYCLASADLPKTLTKEYSCSFANGGYPYLLSGRYSDYSLFFTSHQIDGYIKKDIKSLNKMDYFIFGFQFKKIGIQTTSEFSICFDDPSSSYRDKNKIRFNNNSFILSSETQNSSDFGNINDENWHHIEIKVPYPNPGVWQIYIDGTLTGTWTSTDTITWNELISIRINQISAFTITGDASKGWCIDDFYVLDSFGSIYNDFVGIYARIETLKPNQDYASSLTKVNTTNTYESQNNIPLNNTQYIKGSISSNLFSNCYYEQISKLREIGAVKQTNITSLGDDFFGINRTGDFVFIENSTEIGPVISTRSDVYETTPVYKSSIYNLDPSTNSQWTKTNVNTYKYGVKLKPFGISITNVKDVLGSDLYYPGISAPYNNQKFNYNAYILMVSDSDTTTLNSPDPKQWKTIDYGITSGIFDGSGDTIYTSNYMLVKKTLNGTESSSLIAAQKSITNHSYAIMFITSSINESFYSMNSITDGNGTRYFPNFTYQFSNDRYGILPIRILAPIRGASVTSMTIGGNADWTQISTGMNSGKFYYMTSILTKPVANDNTVYSYNVAMGGVCVAPSSFINILLSK